MQTSANATGGAQLNVQGRLETASRTGVSGWAKGRQAGSSAVVVVHVNGERVAELRCDKPRLNTTRDQEVSGQNDGFELRFPEPLPKSLSFRVTVRNRDTGELLRDGEAFLAAADVAALVPILVTAPGRSGTTFTMGRLARAAQIVVAEAHPYEIRLLAYYATVLRVLTSTADFERSMHPDRLQGDGFRVGFNPFSRGKQASWFKSPVLSEELFSQFGRAEILRAIRHTVHEYYLRLRDEQGKSQARYFAEKANNLELRSRRLPREAFGTAKEILLVRDPRDLLCSQREYFKFQGRPDAGPLIRATAEIARIIDENPGDVLAVRYEDLMLDYKRTAKTISDYLGVEIPAEADGARERASFETHATSETPERSIGRWRTELDVQTVAAFNEGCGAFLRRFDYSL